MPYLIVTAAVMLAVASPTTFAAERPASGPVLQSDGTYLSRRSIKLSDGRTLEYTARAGHIPLREDETGEITANMYFVAYTADRAPGENPRPLTFTWGGGPGGTATLAPSAPRNTLRAGDQYRVIDNPSTILTASDMVYIDTIGTGYSRMTRPEFAPLFYNIPGDAESLAEFIRIYLKRYVSDAPAIFLSGESYGTIRDALVAQICARRGIPVRGLVLVSQGMTYGLIGGDLYSSFLLPSFAAAAYAQHKLPQGLQDESVMQVFNQADEWARTQYLPALIAGNRLPAAQRDIVVSQMSSFTGLPASVIEQYDMRPTAEEFGAALLANDHLQIGLYDGRDTGPATSGPWDATQDPSLMARGDALASPMERLYLRQELGVKSDLLYEGPFGGAWPPPSAPQGDWMSAKWGMGTQADSPAPGVEASFPALLDAIEKNGVHVLIAGGIYDLVTPWSAAEYVASRVPAALRSHVTLVRLQSGHMAPDHLLQSHVVTFIRQVADQANAQTGSK